MKFAVLLGLVLALAAFGSFVGVGDPDAVRNVCICDEKEKAELAVLDGELDVIDGELKVIGGELKVAGTEVEALMTELKLRSVNLNVKAPVS